MRNEDRFDMDAMDRQRERIQRAIVDLAALRDTLPPEKQSDADRIISELRVSLGDEFGTMNAGG
ncbi:hypothetical protein [Arenibaculum pallidiluteum]|uniref:hypothetical protein n=1 Tax=Arenibaculum pallidiluteum TaxID=2812559 RepID=UPI001A97521B|nr:hypothetical protein [Arenibaculum pallidiluteum]